MVNQIFLNVGQPVIIRQFIVRINNLFILGTIAFFFCPFLVNILNMVAYPSFYIADTNVNKVVLSWRLCIIYVSFKGYINAILIWEVLCITYLTYKCKRY